MRALPRIPKVIAAPNGPVSVILVPHPRDYDDKHHDPVATPCWGTYSGSRRLVEIQVNAPLDRQWHTLYHELAHTALMDAGVKLRKKEEAVCDAIADARMRERFGRTVRPETA